MNKGPIYLNRPGFFGPRREPVQIIEHWPSGSSSLMADHCVVTFEPGGERQKVPTSQITFERISLDD